MRSMLWRGGITAVAAATQEPLQVVGLTATASGQTTINLSWTADATPSPNGATSYEVERSVDGLGSWSTIATGITTNSYSDTSLSASTTRYYRVSAYNSFGGALPSASANATTASGSLSPSWSLDFSTGTPSGYTLTRASSGTYVDSSGYVASASTDIARLTHNSSGSRLGLLVEQSSTNLLKHSRTNDATWSTNGATKPSTTETAPNNAGEAVVLRDSTAGTYHFFLQDGVAVSASTQYVYSCYMKANGRNFGCLSMVNSANNLGLGVVFGLTGAGSVTQTNNVGSPTNTSSGITSVGNGWYRCWLSWETGSGVTSSRIFIASSNSGTPGNVGIGMPIYAAASDTDCINLWGAQLETGSVPTAIIPTTTASVTRSADLAHVLDSSITSWGDPGALVVHFYPPGQAGTILSTDDASTAQVGIEASTTTAARAFWSSGSTSTGTIGTGVQKAVHYWNGSTSKFAINGGTVQSGTNNLTIANTDFVTLGAEATESGGVPGTFSQYANFIIRRVEFYSGTLTDANLQTITT